MNAPTINLLAASAITATLLKKASIGENVGKMFLTNPEPSEYRLYLEARREREERLELQQDTMEMTDTHAPQQSAPPKIP